MMGEATRRAKLRGSRARMFLSALMALGIAACGVDDITGGDGNGGGGGGGGGGTVSGRVFRVANSAAALGDLVVDAQRGVVYVSNQENNSVDRIDWSGDQLERTGRALVGAAPWGLTLDNTGDTLIVANSGGTSLSFVDIASFGEARRFRAPNATLWQLSPGEDPTPNDTLVDDRGAVLTHEDFSDRPQYVAQDAFGVVFYSTQPTGAAPDGTIRMVQSDPAWAEREADQLLWTQVVAGNAWGPGTSPRPCYDLATLANIHDPGCVIAFVDSVRIHYESPFLGTQLRIYDHVPGFPDQVIADTSASWYQLTTSLRAMGSDIFMYLGTWQLEEWLNADTTFVMASGNRSSVAIAEGDRDAGRMWLWNALEPHPRLFDRWISDVVNISDYANNTSAQITGLSVNHDGNVIATRGPTGVFFLTNPMRLQGSYTASDINGGAGVALHPQASFDGGTSTTNWAAVGGGSSDVILVDTRHFRRIGRIIVPERVAGALRGIPRRASDEADVIAHLFGITAGGRVFHAPVRQTDINP